MTVWDSLCANRRGLITPSTCPASDAAIWARAGAVVEPSGRLLVTTGNAPYNGRTNFGDSVIELTVPALRVRQVYTPTNQAQLNSSDSDLGSSDPALLGGNLAVLAGKDASCACSTCRPSTATARAVRRAPAASSSACPRPRAPSSTRRRRWAPRRNTTVFVADFSGTAAYVLRSGRLHQEWSNGNAGTSPIYAGGLLYVYNPNQGGVNVYSPGSPRPIVTLPTGSGHWNSPIVVDSHAIGPEGDDNAHAERGVLTIFSP